MKERRENKMNEFSFLRRPVKVVLYAMLFFLTTSVSLIFTLQYVLDGITMEHSKNTYAYIGTIYSCIEDDPFCKIVPEEILQQIAKSDNVAKLDVRETYSGKAEGVTQVADTFISFHTLDNYCALEAVVIEEKGTGQNSDLYEMKPLEIWTGIQENDEFGLIIQRKWDDTNRYLELGNRAFLIGQYSADTGDGALFFYKMSDLEGRYLYTLEPIADYAAFEETLIFKNPYIVIPEGMEGEEKEQYIWAFLNENGWTEWLERKKATIDTFTVRVISDMSLLIPIVEGEAFITEGRELTSTDIGNRVCVISDAVAEANDLKVGDKISLSLADTSYVVDESYEPHCGWESGFPGEQDELLSYGETYDYEVIGIYNTVYRNILNDCFQYSKNDIFIPQTDDGYESGMKTARPYEISIRILGPNYENFMEEFENPLYEQGYAIDVVDSGWENVEDAFYAMESRRGLVLACAIVAFFAAILSFDSLLVAHFRYEYGLCKLLGAYEREARRIFYAGFVTTAVPAVLLAGVTAFVAYEVWIKEQVSAYISEAVFGRGNCVLLLVIGGVAVLVAAFVTLYIMIVRMKRNRVLKLVR